VEYEKGDLIETESRKMFVGLERDGEKQMLIKGYKVSVRPKEF
jgi:hypothetical protein